MTDESTSAIASPPIMMLRWPTCSPTTGLVSSHKFSTLFFFNFFVFIFIYIMSYILDVGSPRPRSTSNRSLSFECINHSGTSRHASDEGGVVSDIDA